MEVFILFCGNKNYEKTINLKTIIKSIEIRIHVNLISTLN